MLEDRHRRGIVGLSALRIGCCATPVDARPLALERDKCRVRRKSLIMSFLELEGLHVFVTGAAGGIGSAIVDEFLGKRFLIVFCTHS
jgi:hypothetical protein